MASRGILEKIDEQQRIVDTMSLDEMEYKEIARSRRFLYSVSMYNMMRLPYSVICKWRPELYLVSWPAT